MYQGDVGIKNQRIRKYGMVEIWRMSEKSGKYMLRQVNAHKLHSSLGGEKELYLFQKGIFIGTIL